MSSIEERNLNRREGNREEDGTKREQICSRSYFICIRMIMAYRDDIDTQPIVFTKKGT